MTQSSLIVEIANQQSLEFDENSLIAIALRIAEDYGFTAGELSIAIVDDPSMRELNREYLEHDYETDVLSFPLDIDRESGNLNGQLIVSADTAAREADELGVSLQTELMLYVTHGTLHLVGFDDTDPASRLEMRSAEQEYLELFGHQPKWVTEEDNC